MGASWCLCAVTGLLSRQSFYVGDGEEQDILAVDIFPVVHHLRRDFAKLYQYTVKLTGQRVCKLALCRVKSFAEICE